MPKFLEAKLKAEYGANSSIPYKVMNKIGAMHGNKETAKGRAMDVKHERKLHPALQQRAQMVKEAHAHLSRAIPGFQQMPAATRMAATQHHVRTRLKNGY